LGAVPAPLEQLVMKMLEKVPGARPQAMEDVIAGLELVMAVPTPVGRTPAIDARVASQQQPLPPTGLLPAALKQVDAETQGVTQQLTPPAVRMPATQPNAVATQPGLGPPVSQPVARSEARARVAQVSGATETSLQAVRPSLMPRLAGGLALLVVGLAAAVVLLPKGEAPPIVRPVQGAPQPRAPTPPAPDAPLLPAEVRITFETTPEGAEVYAGDELLGTTPFTLARKADESVTLTFQLKGYTPLTRKVRFASSGRIAVELERTQDTGAPAGPKSRPKRVTYPPPGEDDLKAVPF
jgi:hypothetical protein